MKSVSGLLTLSFYLRSFPQFAHAATTFNLVDDYAGKTFFDKWDFFGAYDSLNSGDDNFVTRENATTKKLAYTNDAGNAIMKVATDTVAWNEKRDSVRITSQKAYPVGTIWLADLVHLPFGCSVWPAIWTSGPEAQWPDSGEIDILEGINLNAQNQMALHTGKSSKCKHSGGSQAGKSLQQDCTVDAGCTVQDPDTKSYGDGFNKAGGGIYATKFAADGISIWFWSRSAIPKSVQALAGTQNAINSQDDWGTPTANYPSGADCDISKSFQPQKFIFDITLCGVWGKNPDFYMPQCSSRGPTKGEAACYQDNVWGNGTNYADAYFEVKYVRAYVDPNAPPVPINNTTANSTTTTTGGSKGGKGGNSTSAATLSTMEMVSVPAAMLSAIVVALGGAVVSML